MEIANIKLYCTITHFSSCNFSSYVTYAIIESYVLRII